MHQLPTLGVLSTTAQHEEAGAGYLGVGVVVA